MEIKIDLMNKQEINKLCEMLHLYTEDEVNELKEKIEALERENKRLKEEKLEQNVTEKLVNYRGGVKAAVLEIFNTHPDDSFTANEIGKMLNILSDSEMMAKLRNVLSYLKNRKILDSTTMRPKRFFLKENGDPELKEALKNVKRRK